MIPNVESPIHSPAGAGKLGTAAEMQKIRGHKNTGHYQIDGGDRWCVSWWCSGRLRVVVFRASQVAAPGGVRQPASDGITRVTPPPNKPRGLGLRHFGLPCKARSGSAGSSELGFM